MASASLDTSTTSTSEPTILLSGGSDGVETPPEIVVIHQSDIEISGVVGDEIVEGASLTIGDGDGGEGHNNIDSNGNDALSGGGNDLFEKFSQFSDLIVVNPEQLGIGVKRSGSTENNVQDSENQPPSKKICVNGNDDTLSMVSSSIHSRVTNTVSSSGSVLHSALSAAQVGKTNSTNNTTILEEGTSTTTTIAVATSNSSGNQQMVHLPVRLVNAQNSQQISFAGRQMMIQSGQQIVLSGGGSASLAGLQGQVIIKQGGGGDAVTKAYILIPQQNPGGGTNSMASIGGQIVQTISVAGGGQALLSSLPSNPSVNPIQSILSQMDGNCRDGIPPNMVAHLSQDLLEHELPYLCEWSGCGYRFLKQHQVIEATSCWSKVCIDHFLLYPGFYAYG